MDQAGLDTEIHQPEIPQISAIIPWIKRLPNLHNKDQRHVHLKQAITIHQLQPPKISATCNRDVGGPVTVANPTITEQTGLQSSRLKVPIISKHLPISIRPYKIITHHGLYQIT